MPSARSGRRGSQNADAAMPRSAALCRSRCRRRYPAPVRSLMQSSFAASRSGVSSRARPVMANARRNTPDGTAPATARVQSPPRIASRRSRSASASSFASRRQGAVRLSATRSASPAARRLRYARWYAADLRRFSRTMASRCAVSIRTSQKAPRSSRFSRVPGSVGSHAWGAVPSSIPTVRPSGAVRSRPSSEAGSEEQSKNTTCQPASPAHRATRRMRPLFPVPGPPLTMYSASAPAPALNRAGK